MKRDITVTMAVVLLFLSLIGLASNNYTGVFTFTMVLAAIRLAILWFQTFIDAVNEGEVGWALAHVFFTNIASVIYYYKFAGSWDYK